MNFVNKTKYFSKKYSKKIVIYISPVIDLNNTTISFIIDRHYSNDNGDHYYTSTFLSDGSFSYIDLEDRFKKIGINVLSTKETYDENKGFMAEKSCLLKNDGMVLMYNDGVVSELFYK